MSIVGRIIQHHILETTASAEGYSSHRERIKQLREPENERAETPNTIKSFRCRPQRTVQAGTGQNAGAPRPFKEGTGRSDGGQNAIVYTFKQYDLFDRVARVNPRPEKDSIDD